MKIKRLAALTVVIAILSLAAGGVAAYRAITEPDEARSFKKSTIGPCPEEPIPGIQPVCYEN